MRKRKIKLQILVLEIVVIGMTLIGICVVNNSPFSFHIVDSDKIKIRDGTDGNLYVLEDEDALSLSSRLLDFNVKGKDKCSKDTVRRILTNKKFQRYSKIG